MTSAGGSVVITGIGMVTPLGMDPDAALDGIRRGVRAAAKPSAFDATPFACRVCAEVPTFAPEEFLRDPKTARLMNRDGHLAAAAARLALADADLCIGKDYAAEEVGLFGATGLAALRIDEVAPLIRLSATPEGGFDPRRFGSHALRRVRPILSFKILSNMPLCFVSIFEDIRGPNAIYNPWEGQGAQAIARGMTAIRRGEAPCALVGACDTKVHELSFLSLEMAGVFRSWRERGCGVVPGEGAAFLVLEHAARARARGARILARIAAARFQTAAPPATPCAAVRPLVEAAAGDLAGPAPLFHLSAEDGTGDVRAAEAAALAALGLQPVETLAPKTAAGNLFAAAAPVQVGLAARLAADAGGGAGALATCVGHGSPQAAFVLAAAGDGV
jgi:3-oxoacyl-[acyl-carrier-protein] synthase II